MVYEPKRLNSDELNPRPVCEDISIVIPTLGREILEESLYWIASGTCWPACLIVVDQSASPEMKSLLERFSQLGIGAKYIPSTQKGRSAGINRGLEQVKTRYVAITDDDCFVESEWVEQMDAKLREHPGAIVTGRIEAAGDEVSIVVTSREPAVYTRPRLKYDSMSGGNMGTSMEVFHKVGFFDEHESLATSEDGEWSYRALRRGAYIVFAPELGVAHFGWRDPDSRKVQYSSYARSHGGFYGKYIRKGDWFIFLRAILHHGRALRRWLRGIVIGDQEMAQIGRAYVLGLLPGIIQGFRRQ